MHIHKPHTPVETHEQFLQRASQVFPVNATNAWTAFERAVFNNLMANLIFRYGYAEISNEMLQAAFEQMQDIVRRFPLARQSTVTH